MVQVLVLASLFVAAPSAKAAESVAVVAIDNCSQELTSGNARLLRVALSQQAGSRVQTEEQTLTPLGGPVKGSVDDAMRLLESARLHSREEFGSGRKTTKVLDEATAILMSLPPSEPRRWKALCDVLSFQAQVYYMDNKPKAEKALEPILRVDPSFQVDRERYSPDMWRLTDKVRKRVRSSAWGALSVTTRPSMVPVYVNGRNMGKSPVTVDLPPGEYRVEAQFGKERALARTVTLKDAVALELDQSLDGAVRVGAGPCLATSGTREARLGALMKLAAYLNVNQAVGVWQEEPVKGEVYLVAAAVDAESGQQVREAKVKVSGGQMPLGGIEKLAGFISKGDAPPPVLAVVTKPQPVPREVEVGPDTKVTREILAAGSSSGPGRPGLRIASYVSGGVALAAFAVGGYGLISAGSSQRELDKMKIGSGYPQGSEGKVDRLSKQISSRKTLGVVAIGTGVAAVGAAVGLFIYSSSPPVEKSVKVSLLPNAVQLSMGF